MRSLRVKSKGLVSWRGIPFLGGLAWNWQSGLPDLNVIANRWWLVTVTSPASPYSWRYSPKWTWRKTRIISKAWLLFYIIPSYSNTKYSWEHGLYTWWRSGGRNQRIPHCIQRRDLLCEGWLAWLLALSEHPQFHFTDISGTHLLLLISKPVRVNFILRTYRSS